MKIPGSVAIVTGGARGLGKAFSEALLKRGCKVCFADVDERQGLATQQSLRQKYGDGMSMFIKCDVTSQSDVEALWSQAVQKYKNIDLLVNNAGILSEQNMQKTVDINLVGAMRGTMMAFEHMRKDKGGRGGLVVNVASTAGLFPVFFMPIYAASKYGLVGFTRSWAFNPSQKLYGVNFSLLCPSFTDTDMLQSTMDNVDATLTTQDENKKQTQDFIDKMGINTVDEVSAAFVKLVEREDNNGAVLSLDKTYGVSYRYAKHPFKL